MMQNMRLPTHITHRDGIYQYVRRVPDDVAGHLGLKRIQKSLKTRDATVAKMRALVLDEEWTRRFDEARVAIGRIPRNGADDPLIGTTAWDRESWMKLAEWVGYTLLQDDWVKRVDRAPGRLLRSNPSPADIPVDDDEAFVSGLKLKRLLDACCSSAYIKERHDFIASLVRRLGISLDPRMGFYRDFMRECHSAELRYFETWLLRNQQRGGIGNRHPDEVNGPWRSRSKQEPAKAQQTAIADPLPAPRKTSGYTLDDCIEKWRANRKAAGRRENKGYLVEMRKAAFEFSQRYRVTDVAHVTRRDLVEFRDTLADTGMAAATVNKKIGYLTTLVNTAYQAAWIEQRISDNLRLLVPASEGERDPYPDDVIDRIFSNKIFTQGYRHKLKKAGAELQFWLPLISCLHGMSSSEILQLGPDTVAPHEKEKGILCFHVTNAGSRRMKEDARKRYVPVRQELIAFGLLDLVEKARQSGRRFIWSTVATDDDVGKASNYFSSFWSYISKREFGIDDPRLALYSFRHAFQDRLDDMGCDDTLVKALMGHSASGMTKSYGRKRQPKRVPIKKLSEIVNDIDWQFLRAIKP
ncbi:MAG: DUF6538 domain-containing protein [Salinarimonas sp.]